MTIRSKSRTPPGDGRRAHAALTRRSASGPGVGLRNKFFEQVREAELGCASIDELRALLGKGRAKKGMFEGDLDEGELEIGQVVSLVDEIKPIGTIFDELLKEYRSSVTRLKNIL